jgi:hypothetical protein
VGDIYRLPGLFQASPTDPIQAQRKVARTRVSPTLGPVHNSHGPFSAFKAAAPTCRMTFDSQTFIIIQSSKVFSFSRREPPEERGLVRSVCLRAISARRIHSTKQRAGIYVLSMVVYFLPAPVCIRQGLREKAPPPPDKSHSQSSSLSLERETSSVCQIRLESARRFCFVRFSYHALARARVGSKQISMRYCNTLSGQQMLR